MQEEFEFTDALLSAQAKVSNKKRAKRLRLMIAAAFMLIATVTLVTLELIHKQNPNQIALQKIGKSVSYPLYYPSALPTYYVIDTGSVNSNNGIVLFTINGNDQQKIFVSEQSLPPGFNAAQVTGKNVAIPNVGSMTIGTGFQGYRAVIETKHTLIFISSGKKITAKDFANVAKSFLPV